MKKLLLIAAVALTAAACSSKADAPDGSELNPFIVDSEAALRKVGSGANGWGLDKHYRQTRSITLNGSWTSIGTLETRFTGSYNGGGFSINKLNIPAATTTFQAMFGTVGVGGAVRNVALRNVSVNSTVNCVGGIAGSNHGTIENCYVTGSVSGGLEIGGVAGYNSGMIKNCYTTCTVTSNNTRIGGIAGCNALGGTVSNCYATGKITGNNNVGGIVGENPATVQFCVALNMEVSVSTTGTVYVGRVVSGFNTYTLTDNFARAGGMKLMNNGSDVPLTEATTSGKDGANVLAANTHGENALNWWSNGGDSNLWSFANNRLPHLKTTTGGNFSDEQNPTMLYN